MTTVDEAFYLTTVDPGGTTGMALWQVTPSSFSVLATSAVTWQPERQITPLSTLKTWGENHTDLPHVLLYEGFRLRPQKDPELVSLEVIGAIRYWLSTETRLPTRPSRLTLHRLGNTSPAFGPYCTVLEKEPVEGKHLTTDDALDRLGLITTGADRNHIHDAHRHAASWLADLSYLPVCRGGWAKRGAAAR